MVSVSRVRNYKQLCRCHVIVIFVIILNTFLFLFLRSPSSSLPHLIISLEPVYIQFSDRTKCVGVRKGVLVVSKCGVSSDITEFLYDGGVLRLPATPDSCVVVRSSNFRILEIGSCTDAVEVTQDSFNKTLMMSSDSQPHWHKEASCVSTRDAGPNYEILAENDQVSLRFCSSNPIRARLIPVSKFIEEMLTPLPVATSPPYNQPCTKCNDTGHFRVQFTHEGRCVVHTPDRLIVVGFCDPNKDEGFLYSNGILMTSRGNMMTSRGDMMTSRGDMMTSSSDNCVGVDKSTSRLVLVPCQRAIRLVLEDGELKRPAQRQSREFCVQPESKDDSSSTLVFSPELGTRVVLGPCQNYPASSITLIPEEDFLTDRSALILTRTQEQLPPSCPFPACMINERASPPLLLPEDHVIPCSNLASCVTVVVKTARRPWFIIRLARSVQENLGEGVSMVVVDDGPPSYSPQIMARLGEFANMRYVIADKPDLGIAEGRMRGVMLVETKYFLSFDDDFIVTNTSGIREAVDLLDKSDLSVVGAKGGTSFAGNVDFVLDSDKHPALRLVHGSCNGADSVLPFKSDCRRCDLTINCFVAKTSDVIQAGGWSRELKVSEHLDFFLRLKAAKKKVAYCSSLKLLHDHSYVGLEFAPSNKTKPIDQSWYWRLRWSRTKLMTARFLNHWNIHSVLKRTKGSGQEDEGVYKPVLNETHHTQDKSTEAQNTPTEAQFGVLPKSESQAQWGADSKLNL